ncbi:TPA: hypothetical protein ACE8AD_002189, partial [Neisseria gonorrhoeae]
MRCSLRTGGLHCWLLVVAFPRLALDVPFGVVESVEGDFSEYEGSIYVVAVPGEVFHEVGGLVGVCGEFGESTFGGFFCGSDSPVSEVAGLSGHS